MPQIDFSLVPLNAAPNMQVAKELGLTWDGRHRMFRDPQGELIDPSAEPHDDTPGDGK